jgi:hypothetical protein
VADDSQNKPTNDPKIRGQFPDMDFIMTEDHRLGLESGFARTLVIETHIPLDDTPADVLQKLIGAIEDFRTASAGDLRAKGQAAFDKISAASDLTIGRNTPALAMIQAACMIVNPQAI